MTMKTVLILACAAAMSLGAFSGSAEARHRDGGVDLVLRIGSGTIVPSLWYNNGYGYYHQRYHPRSRFRHGLQTRTRITRGGFVERIYISRGRIIDTEIVGRVDRYGNSRFFRNDRRFAGHRGRNLWYYNDWYDDSFRRSGRHSRDRWAYDDRRDRRRDRYDDRRDRRDDRWDRRDDRRDDRWDNRDDRRDDRRDSRRDRRDGEVRGRVMPSDDTLDRRLEGGRRGRAEILENEEDFRARNKGDGVTGRVVYPD
ncbi:hypothetical protein [Parvularcula maris]|uniref:Uncharacterized protein n=1 Tax=Parvularcula maris TaxID=2965077 RepID=A0A9X2L971_9PROT|nr:hypothetical protein [Parvularcula maris]MCQ8185229.1 hypothetical protein [Parvularcula maris]